MLLPFTQTWLDASREFFDIALGPDTTSLVHTAREMVDLQIASVHRQAQTQVKGLELITGTNDLRAAMDKWASLNTALVTEMMDTTARLCDMSQNLQQHATVVSRQVFTSCSDNMAKTMHSMQKEATAA